MEREQIILALIIIGIVVLAFAIAPHMENASVDANGVVVAKILIPGRLP